MEINKRKLIIGSIITLFIFLIKNCVSYFNSFTTHEGHGSIISNTYCINKRSLSAIIDSIIVSEITLNRKPLSKNDDNHYNKGAYFTLLHKSNEYVFRYKGDEEYWIHSDTSIIFLAFMSSDNYALNDKTSMLNDIDKVFINKLNESVKCD